MPPIATILRYHRPIVSCRIKTPRGPGWHGERLWRALERAAFKVINHTMTDGLLVSSCPPALAAAAVWGDLPGFSMRPHALRARYTHD